MIKLIKFFIKVYSDMKEKRAYKIKKSQVWARQLQYLNEFGKSNKKSPCLEFAPLTRTNENKILNI